MSRARNVTTGEIVAANVHVITDPVSYVLGWLHPPSVAESNGLWLTGRCTIHTFGLRDEIDVIFLDDRNRVIKTLCAVPPNRVAIFCPNARTVIELGAGALAATDVLVGDHVALE